MDKGRGVVADRSVYNSWAAIADTSGQTDEEVQERRTATAAYRLIVASREDSKRHVETL